MQRYYCDKCARYFETDNCPTHGSERIVYLDSDSFANANIQGVRTPDATPSGVSVSAAGKLQSDAPAGKELPKKISEKPLQDQHPKKTGPGQPHKVESREILRFLKSERRLHWSIAIPFIICWTTALVLVFVYNPNPLRPYRDLISWIHQNIGCLPYHSSTSGRADRMEGIQSPSKEYQDCLVLVVPGPEVALPHGAGGSQ